MFNRGLSVPPPTHPPSFQPQGLHFIKEKIWDHSNPYASLCTRTHRPLSFQSHGCWDQGHVSPPRLSPNQEEIVINNEDMAHAHATSNATCKCKQAEGKCDQSLRPVLPPASSRQPCWERGPSPGLLRLRTAWAWPEPGAEGLELRLLLMKPSSVAGAAGPQASLLAALVGRDCQGKRKTTAGTEARGQRLGTSPADSEPPTPTPGGP